MAVVAVGGMLASATLKVVTQQIASAIGSNAKLARSFKGDLEKMKMTLESLEAVLSDAEGRSIRDAAVRLWLKRLTAAMYDISDMLDEFEESDAENTTAGRKLAVKIPCLVIFPNISMGRKLKIMRDKLKEITDQHQSFRFMVDNNYSEKQVKDKRATSSYVEEALIVGREKDKQRLLECLYRRTMQETIEEHISILAIYGIGGIGKTTLAKLVFNHTQFKDYSQVWIHVSQTFDLDKIGNSIISQVSKQERPIIDRQVIHNALRRLLTGMKILVVLDDLWETDAFLLEELKAMLKVGKDSVVVVIVTTRDECVATKVCTIEPYRLEPLTDEMCWNIIKQKSFFKERNDTGRLEQIGREIAAKCGGVALAAQSIGYMLQSMKFDEWVSIRNSDIWKESTSKNTSNLPHYNVLASLLLSYNSLPSYLKLCFSYCAMFPKGHKIIKDDLIHQWIALGFIEPSSIFSTWQLSENYVKQLLGMSFLQQASPSALLRRVPLPSPLFCSNAVRRPLSKSTVRVHGHGPHGEDVKLFTVHDLVHDLARSVMVDEFLNPSKDNKIWGSNFRYALLTDYNRPLPSFATSSGKIRALRFIGCAEIDLVDAAISSAKYLRVLDLSECSLRKLPSSIGHLKQLRYLNAPRVNDRIIPECITKLSKLSYFNLGRSYTITALPESTGEMEGLMHLDLSYCWRIKELPKSFRKLKKLVHLDLSNCRSIGGVSKSLLDLTELQYLNLSNGCHSENLTEVLNCLTKLQYLNLSHCSSYGNQLGLLQRPEVLGNLTGLQHLNLSNFLHSRTRAETQIFIEYISKLTNLEHVDLSENKELESIPESFGNLRKLHTLDLSSCFKLVNIPENVLQIDSLKFVIVKNCMELDKTMLSRFNNGSAFLPHFAVQSGLHDSGSNLVLLQEANPVQLEISNLDNVKSTEEARSIRLLEKRRLLELKFEWTRNAKRFVEDIELLGELQPSSTLKRFELQGYNSVNFPPWLMGISLCLPNLVIIEMVDLPNCDSLPPLGELPNLEELLLSCMNSITKIDEGFYGHNRSAFRRLKEFRLIRMGNLEEWKKTYFCGEESMFPNLRILGVYYCPKLRLSPRQPAPINWEVWDNGEHSVLSSWSSWGNGKMPLGSMEMASEEHPKALQPSEELLKQWRLLHNLPSLCSLRIEASIASPSDMAPDLSSLESLCFWGGNQAELPEWIGQLASLKSLSLHFCRSMVSLPQWLGKLASLNKLIISECESIKSLPDSIQQLTNLKELRIYNCRALQQWYKSEVDKRKLSHIKEKKIW